MPNAPARRRAVLGADDVRRALTRIAHEIIERNHGLDSVMLLGIRTGGVWMADRLGHEVARIEHAVPVGALDVAFHRDGQLILDDLDDVAGS